MSLYNALCGVTPGWDVLLQLLDLTPESVGRFRDCFLNSDLQIVVYTRIGGGNREEYESVIETLRFHPLYAKDYDDDFDSTFAYFVFNIPEKVESEDGIILDNEWWRLIYNATTAKIGTPRERFDRVMQKMGDPNTPKDDPELVNATAVGNRILDPILSAVGNGQCGVIEVAPDGGVKSVMIDRKEE